MTSAAGRAGLERAGRDPRRRRELRAASRRQARSARGAGEREGETQPPSSPASPQRFVPILGSAPMPGPTQTLSPNGENNNDIIQDNGTIIPFRKHTVRGERSYR
ncbi:hypothetical protein J1605_018001 [Eschrichtius robustus]|uniref:Uncharacterized protein n=1 Tax=Eschrichtius robustus TaxID=9764 RepID=A0AB34HW01_ESCRO|nr:hypothetical protein J1605_018001 [Eschrichtius robustus]